MNTENTEIQQYCQVFASIVLTATIKQMTIGDTPSAAWIFDKFLREEYAKTLLSQDESQNSVGRILQALAITLGNFVDFKPEFSKWLALFNKCTPGVLFLEVELLQDSSYRVTPRITKVIIELR